MYNVGNKRNVVTKKANMEQVFQRQIESDTSVREVFFIQLNDNGPDTVVSFPKKKLNELPEFFEYVDTEPGRLPRFIKK